MFFVPVPSLLPFEYLMRHHTIVGISLILAGLIACVPASAQTSRREPIPAAAAQARAHKLIQELYQAEINKAANDPVARARLASVFVMEARDTNDDAAGRYVLLDGAYHLAADAGDAATALEALEEMAQFYAVSDRTILKNKIDVLQRASKAAGINDGYQNVIDASVVLLDDVLADDDYASCDLLLQAAETAARKLKDVPQVAGLRRKQEEVRKLAREYARWQPFAGRLAKNPDDAEASFEMGSYLAFVKGNWNRAIPLLARGSDPALKKLAAAEQKASSTGQMVQLGEQWFEQAKSRKEANVQALLRAHHWFQQALGGSADARERARVEQQMEALSEMLPADQRIGEIARELRVCQGQGSPVYCAAFSPNGKKIISSGADGVLRLWEARTGRELRHFDALSGRVWAVAFMPDGRRAVSGGFDGSVRIWDLASGREVRHFAGHGEYVRSVAVSTDGRFVLSGGDDRLLRLWNVETGAEVRNFPGHDNLVWSVALSRDGSRALSASLDRTVRLWNTGTGKELKVLEGHTNTVLSVAFLPDGRRAVSGSTDQTLIVWDLETGKDLLHLESAKDKGYVYSVAVSPDGRRLLSAGQEGILHLWDAHNGKELRQLTGHRGEVWQVAFSPNGRLAVSCGQDGNLRIWGRAK